MAIGDIDTFLFDNPWEMMTENQRQVYDPWLRDNYRKKRVFGQFTQFDVNLGAVNTETMTITKMFDAHPNTDAIGKRQNWVDARHLDSARMNVTFSRYGGKVAYHRYDDKPV